MAIYAVSGIGDKTAIILYPSMDDICTIQKIDINDAISSSKMASVILQPINLIKVAVSVSDDKKNKYLKLEDINGGSSIMAVPKTREILLPLFKILRENNVIAFREATNLVALRMNLNEDDKAFGTEKSNALLTNVSFASSMLKEKEIMAAPKSGVWQITKKGNEISIEEFCELFNIIDENVIRKTGEEFFCLKDKRLNFQIKDFWSWNQSDILNNALRGILAEYIVATAIEAKNEMRIEWDAYDLVTEKGIRVEVKSSSYLQSWKQIGFSKISFDISPTKKLITDTNGYDSDTRRQADVYVFCLLKHKDKVTVNPLNIDQWEFYIVSTK